MRHVSENYNIEQSYAKEEKLKQDKADDVNSMLGFIARDGFINIEPSAADETARETEPLQEQYKSKSGFLVYVFILIVYFVK